MGSKWIYDCYMRQLLGQERNFLALIKLIQTPLLFLNSVRLLQVLFKNMLLLLNKRSCHKSVHSTMFSKASYRILQQSIMSRFARTSCYSCVYFIKLEAQHNG